MEPQEKPVLTAYNTFIKERLAEVQKEYPSNSHNENMKMVNAMWKPQEEPEEEPILTAYNKFIKERLADIKKDYPSNSHNENMKLVNAMWPPPEKD